MLIQQKRDCMPMVTLRTAVIVNILLVLLYILADAGLALQFNLLIGSHKVASVTSVVFTPLVVNLVNDGMWINGVFAPANGVITAVNLPFMAFFLTIIVNLYFIFKLQRSKEAKPA